MRNKHFEGHIDKTDYGVEIIGEGEASITPPATYIETREATLKNGEGVSKDEPEIHQEREKPKKRLKEEAREKIESILNIRTFLLISTVTLLLALYIHNVISINRLSGESERMKLKIDEAKSLNIELHSELKGLERSERIGREAFEKLGLQVYTKQPIELSK